MKGRTPTKENVPQQGPSAGPVSALKRRPPAGGDAASPSKQQRKKSKPDRRSRRVSFAPDPELTMVHHFEKDEFSAHTGEGRPLSVLGEESEGGGSVGPAAGAGEYEPGFWNKTVPDNTSPLPLDSPGMVSMEITQPVVLEDRLQQAHQQPLLPEEQGEEELGPEAHAWAAAAGGPGEVTAGLPSLGALAEADEAYEEELAAQQHQQQGSLGPAAGGWGGVAAADVTLNLTHNITSGIPGLSSLIAEDEEGDAAGGSPGAEVEEATAGMDLTVAAGRVLEHAAAAPGPAEQPAAGPEAAAEAAPAAPGRRSSTGEVAQHRAVQVNKWGFAPGGEDTLDINLELHGRMIMGDTTFNRMYGDNTTGDTTLGQPAGGAAAEELGREDSVQLPVAAAPAEPQGPAEQHADEPLLSPEPTPLGLRQQQAALAGAAAGAQAEHAPNWQAPAFVPPFLQKAPTVTSDHPALVQSPADTNSTMNTLETRRISVGGDTRRLSITSRGLSVQEGVTGRLLDDDFDDDLGVGGLGLQAPHQPAAPAAARHSDAHMARENMTEKLLADDEEETEEGLEAAAGDGPLATMKRTLRQLSQEALLPEQEPAAPPASMQHGEQPEQEQPAAHKAALTPPRPAVSYGVADSSNPATMALLRSGGTTRLLQDTVHVKVQQQQQQHSGAPAPRPAHTSGGGGGTTKLLADMTMASMVGAKLRGQGPLGGRRLSQEDGGLTDYSLDGFDTPPELPMGQQQQNDGEAAPGGAQQAQQAAHPQLEQFLPPAEQGQEDETLLDGENAQQGQGEAAHEAQLYHDGTPQPATSQGYPLNLSEQQPLIPGGPKLHRTPVQARPSASLQRTQGTPHSVRSAPQQATPGSRRADRTPVSAARPTASAATYPLPEDDTIGHIPGGPKLARTPLGGRGPQHHHVQPPQHEQTPVGRTPATGRRPPFSAGPPGSAMAQHYPGAGYAPPSALALRYPPGSAMAVHRLGSRGLTPIQQQQQPLPMTFQDFTKLMDVQFLDNLRRGASINYADMQRNPVPKTLQEAYTLLCAIEPQVGVLENGIRILQELVQERRLKSAECETFIGMHNPQLFAEVQYVDEEQLEQMKAGVGLLKKLLRQKAVAELKAYRKEMEEDKAHRLMRNLELLQQDRLFLEGNERQAVELARATQEHVAAQQRRMVDEAAARQAEAERRQRMLSMRASLEEQEATNAQRQQQLQEVQSRVARLKTQNSVLGQERAALRNKVEALEQRLAQTQDAAVLAQQSSPQALLDKCEQLEVLTACSGLRLERLQQGSGMAELALRVADLFLVQLRVGGGSASGTVQLAPGAAPHLPEDRRQLVAGLAVQYQIQASLAGAGTAALAAALQAASAQLGCLAQLAAELEELRLGCPSLAHLACTQDVVRLGFVNLDTEVQFSVALRVPATYPRGEMPHELSIRSDGSGHVTEEGVGAALAGVPQGRGRLTAMCTALSRLAASAPAPDYYFQQPAQDGSEQPTDDSCDQAQAAPAAGPTMTPHVGFLNFSNPLYGASASCSMQS